ncbi:hypothetical protein F0Z19_2874 [Vibrio cyclitrophicus]|nr:hypothetical protein F0Z19_2874 [Vibrio cyclitrophicus]
MRANFKNPYFLRIWTRIRRKTLFVLQTEIANCKNQQKR